MKLKYLKNGIEIDGELILLSTIIDECNKCDINDKVLLEMNWPESRGFDGCFEQIVLPSKNADRIKEMMLGEQVYFGGIAGKHSEVHGDMEECDFNIITDQKTILKFLSDNPSGQDYDHSFLETFGDALEGEELKEWEDLF